MLEMNKVLLIGNLTRDPELSYISSGSALAKMRLALNRRFKDKSGESREETDFVDVEAWGKTAEFCSNYLAKGRRVFVEGRLRYSQWEGSDGSKRSKISVTADRVQFADSKPREDDGFPSASAGGAASTPADAPETEDDLPF